MPWYKILVMNNEVEITYKRKARTIICQECGKENHGVRFKFCSNRCAVNYAKRAKRRRDKEAQNAANSPLTQSA
jgi:ribosomal protein L37E